MTPGAEDRKRLKLLAVGVGGQGVLTAARCLGEAALMAGLEVMVGQLHGMSQRGGSVEATALIGPGRGAFIAAGAADIVLGLEPLEVLRARNRCSARTRVLFSRGQLVPHTLAQAGAGYPDLAEILGEVRAVAPEVVELDTPALIAEVGEARTLNIIMLGALAGLELLPFDGDLLWSAIARRTGARHRDLNQRAFRRGMEAVSP